MNAPEKTGLHLGSPRFAPCPLVWRCTGLLALGAMLTGSVLAAQAPSPVSEPLGTLFYSAAERGAVTRARQGQSELAPISSLMTVNGLVKRQSGKGTVWVNGQAIREGHSAPPAARLTTTQRGVTLDGTPVRVGETLDLSTRERSDMVAPGAVTVRTPK